MAKDHAASAITSILKPVLLECGFYRRNQKTFVRVRGDLVDVISFQLSQYGSRLFYVHHFCNLLPMPNSERLLSSYRVGSRIDSDPSGPKWVADTENAATAAMESVVAVCQSRVLPWLDGLNGVKEWLIEYIAKPGSPLESFDVAIAMLLLGHTQRPWWILSDLSELPIDPELDVEKQRTFRSQAKHFADAVHNKSHDELLAKWRSEAIKSNGIEKALNLR